MPIEPRFQYVLDEAECRLFNELRELEAEHKTEYPLILNGTDPKVDKTFKLTFELEGRRLGTFEVAGTQLLARCASASIQVVRQVLSSEEHVASHVHSLGANRASEILRNEPSDDPTPSSIADDNGEEAPEHAAVATPASWNAVIRDVIPSYVSNVSFNVPQPDLTAERRTDLEIRFPEVMILSSHGTGDQNKGDEAQAVIQRRIYQTYTPDTESTTSLNKFKYLPVSATYVSTASEQKPAKAKLSSSRSSIEPSNIASGSPRNSGTQQLPAKLPNTSPIMSLARCIGLESSISAMVRNMWLHWKQEHEVMPFAAVRHHRRGLEEFYQDLVTLYILGHHKNESDLCYAVLLMFQSTNYKYRNTLPNVSTAVSAFQYLREDSDLCRWIATIFSFLWGTQQYHSHEMLLAAFPQADKNAFSTFLFAIAYTRDTFTKGHNTAVLDQWCKVHHHQEDDEEAILCKAVFEDLRDSLDKIRKREADDEYAEAKRVMDEHEKSLRSQSTNKGGSPIRAKKRKAESTAVESKKEQKRGSRRSGLGRVP
ncbi:hypothetical protein SVAN01_02887 [Stagonosporopsis vannaccii]|nr:hypothetical protein SVAN01_02887 [Stagonosporopsis vannaccii]